MESKQPTLPPLPDTSPSQDAKNKRMAIIAGVVIVVLLAVFVTAIVLLVQPTTDTARVRDIFIIFMALEMLLIGFSLLVLIVQLAKLINLLQNEVKPILDATNETAKTLRGTAAFLGDNLTGPVIKLNEYVAALQKLVSFLRVGRK